MEGSTECFDALICSGARRLTGYQRRMFMAEVATELCVCTPGRGTVVEGSTECFDALICSGARRLTGYQRRMFMAEVATELCEGSAVKLNDASGGDEKRF